MRSLFKLLSGLMAILFVVSLSAQAQEITSAGSGGELNWSDPSSWVGGVIPGPSNTVVIVAGDTMYVDTSAVIAGLTVGESTGGARLRFVTTGQFTLTVNGSIVIEANSLFNVNSSTTGLEVADSILVSGDFLNFGTIDFVSGSAGSSKTTARLIFTGATNTTFSCTPYVNSSTNEFGGVTIRKTGGAKVTLEKDLVNAGGSSSSAANVNPYIRFESGLIEARPGVLASIWTTSSSFQGYGPDSYVIGTVARGISNGGGGTTKEFPVGDETGYRPVTIHFQAPGNSTGHAVLVSAIPGNATTVTSALGAGIDKVSEVRYYSMSYKVYSGSGAAYMDADEYSVPYSADDGVAEGNTNLRVAVTDSTGTTWMNGGPLAVLHTTDFDSVFIESDSVYNRFNKDGGAIYLALARATGTTENTLVSPGTSVDKVSDVPSSFALEQNFPNPFNPSTQIRFTLEESGVTTLKVMDLLGREVATLLSQDVAPGTYSVTWDASNVAAGVYLCQLTSGTNVSLRKMVLLK